MIYFKLGTIDIYIISFTTMMEKIGNALILFSVYFVWFGDYFSQFI